MRRSEVSIACRLTYLGIRGSPRSCSQRCYQHGNGQVRKRFGDREDEISIPPNRRYCLSGEHVAIRAGGKLLAQDDFRVSPGLGTHRDAGMRSKLSKEPSGQHQDRGPAERAGESDHVFVLFSSGRNGR